MTRFFSRVLIIFLIMFIFSYIYFGLMFSKKREHIRRNLLFYLIGHFGHNLAQAPWTTTSTPLSSTDKSHYLPPSQVLPSLWRPFHSGSTYARDLSKTKVTIYLTWESHMCRKPDSPISFYLIYFYIYGVIFILFWFVVLKDERTLKM